MFGLKLPFFRKKTMQREIIINAESLETRVAVVENGKLEEFMIEHPTEERIVGSVYLGRVQNLEEGLHAAFVDIGMKKNAFIHYWDMIPEDAGRLEAEEGGGKGGGQSRRRSVSHSLIAGKFPIGSSIVVQVSKGPIGTKGPRVTANVSLPGRYLVLMPGSNLKGISRKIADPKERQRLKKTLGRLPVPENAGLIIRTVAEDVNQRSIARDMRSLIGVWTDMQDKIRKGVVPSCVYEEPGLIDRVVRDWLTEDVDRIVVDSRERYEEVRKIAGVFGHRVRARIQLYDGDVPVFEHFDIERQLEEALHRRITLKSGGYIIFDETEALIAIDVNTGRHKAKTHDDAILEVNMEAVEEIARQLRLRNVGGLVMIDLIDMSQRKHQNAVYKAFREALKRDKARTNVLPISKLGILEMSRQRIEESVLSSMFMDCPYCRGRGRVLSSLSMSVEIQRQIAAVLRRKKAQGQSVDLQILVNPHVLERLKAEDEQLLMELQSKFAGHLSFRSGPAVHHENFSILNAETNEVLYTSEKHAIGPAGEK